MTPSDTSSVRSADARRPLLVAVRNPYLIAVASAGAALGGTLLLQGAVPDRHLTVVLFFAAVAISTGLGGLWSGVLATLLSALACDYFLLSPVHSFAVAKSDLPLLALFIIGALLINGASGRLRAQTIEADRRYYGLVQGLDGIVWEMNPRTFELTFVSNRAELLLGYPIARWLSERDFRLRITHPEDANRMKELWAEAISKGGEHTADYRAVSADGREVWIRETIYVRLDSHGRPDRITGLGIDITARMAEAAEMTRLKDEFAALNAIAAALSDTLELDDFLGALRAELQLRLGVDAGSLYLSNETSEGLALADSWGMGADGACGPFHPPISNSRIVTSIPVALEGDLINVEALWVPLLAKDALRGALVLHSAQPARLDRDRWTFLAALGRQVGTLLHNVTLYQEVLAARERLHQLSRQLVSVQEAERRAIARELHDEIGQVLTGLKLTIEMSSRATPDSRSDHLDQALTLVQDLIRRVEGLSLDLRPPMLDDLGLLPALHWHIKRYTALTGVNVQFEHSGVGKRFAPEVEITAYRIIQEALTNVARHSGVSEAAVRLWATREILGIQVVDSGRGFDTAETSQNVHAAGLTGMTERATLLDGHMVLETAPGAGASITVDIPLHHAPDSAVPAPGPRAADRVPVSITDDVPIESARRDAGAAGAGAPIVV